MRVLRMKTGNTGEYFGTAARLLGHALRHRYARLMGTPLKPQAVSLALTNRCNSHCIMCNIWQRSKEQPDIKNLELSSNEVIGLLSRPLFSELVELDLTGGEPHLRDDLVDIAIDLAELKKSYLPKLKSIIITSNGLLPERIISNNRSILESLRNMDIDLVSVASVDGIGETHDKIRGTKGAFKLASRTIDGLIELREQYPNYFIGLKTTILPQNIDELDAILDFALEKHLFYIISPVFFTETRFRNTDKQEALKLGDAEYEKAPKFYFRRELDTNYFCSRIRDYLAAGKKTWACTALYNYLFIEFDGTVYPCELIPETVGNIRKQSIEDIWKGTLARGWRKRIGKLERCSECIEPGAVRYSACAGGLSYLKFLRKLGKSKFTESLHGEGYSKYLND